MPCKILPGKRFLSLFSRLMFQKKAFDKVFPDGVMFKSALQDTILAFHTDRMRIQSAFWKFYLMFWKPGMEEVVRSNTWAEILKKKRAEYLAIKEQFLKAPPSDSAADPLEIAAESAEWSTYYADERLKNEVIAIDILRLFQDHPFFRNHSSESTRKITNKHLITILNLVFLHQRQHPEIEYAQGYHEICGITYYLMKQEMQCEPADPGDPDYSYHLLFDKSPESIEADTFWLYSRIVEVVAPLYSTDPDNNIYHLCTRVQSDILRLYDSELSSFLDENAIPPVYMVPWGRLLFSRVFPLPEVIKLWTKFWVFAPDIEIVLETAACTVLAKKKEIYEAGLKSTTDILHTVNEVQFQEATDIIRQAIARVRNAHPTEERERNKAEPICVEMGNWLEKCATASKAEVIEALQAFRDAWKTLVVTQSDSLMESAESPLMDSLVMSLTGVPILPPPEPTLPKASGAAVVNMDILTEEGDEHVRPKQDLFGQPKKNLFE